VVCECGDDGRTEKHILDIRKLLATYCKGPYSEEITKFAPILRSGGKFRKFNFEACEKVRRSRKGKYNGGWTARKTSGHQGRFFPPTTFIELSRNLLINSVESIHRIGQVYGTSDASKTQSVLIRS
jgi:hypothetical protein